MKKLFFAAAIGLVSIAANVSAGNDGKTKEPREPRGFCDGKGGTVHVGEAKDGSLQQCKDGSVQTIAK